MLKNLDKTNFESEVLNYEGTVLVDFYADWCGPCKKVAPIVEEIANEYTEFVVGKVNVDDNNMLAMKYRVVSIPTLLVFKKGKETARLIGYKPKEAIVEALK